MRIAIPLQKGRLSTHFGVSPEVAVFDVDDVTKQVLVRQDQPLPPHAPGRLPQWLVSHGVDVVIAGGMGERAQSMLAAAGVEVILGAPYEPPEVIIAAWLEGRLKTDPQPCNHDHHGHDHCH